MEEESDEEFEEEEEELSEEEKAEQERLAKIAQEVEMIANLLKMTNSVEIELVPWTSNFVEKKTFNWTLTAIDEFTLKFDFFFADPLYVS